jgi:hypothetical protein
MRGAVLGNTWTKVVFGVSEDDAREIARWISLGTVDPYEVKHEPKTETQQPITIPLSEQEHELATTLANQAPRKAVVRDHLGTTRIMWTISLKIDKPDAGKIRGFRQRAQEQHGNQLNVVEQELAQLYQTFVPAQLTSKEFYE